MRQRLGKDIYYKKSQVKNIKYKTCSLQCSSIAKKTYYKGNNNPKSKKLNKFERFFHDRCISVKRRADAAGIPFDLDREYLIQLYNSTDGRCHYSGIKMNISGKAGPKGNANPEALSVDKINPDLGYIKGNIVLCLNSINMFKGNQDIIKFREIVEALILNIKETFPLKVKKLYPDAIIPKKSDPHAAGIDLYTHRIEDCGEYLKIYTGISIEPKYGYWFMLTPRSSMFKKGLTLYNNIGIIDTNYRGEIIAICLKTSNFIMPEVGDRLVQLVPQRQIWINIEEVNELNSTDRNDKGFGSSGVK